MDEVMLKKKIVSNVLCICALATSLAPLSACNRGGQYDEKVDEGKTQLYVSNYDGGFGSQWLMDLKEAFETANAGVSFEIRRRKHGKQRVLFLVSLDLG